MLGIGIIVNGSIVLGGWKCSVDLISGDDVNVVDVLQINLMKYLPNNLFTEYMIDEQKYFLKTENCCCENDVKSNKNNNDKF